MVTGVLSLALVLLPLLLAAFIYQIVTTPLTAVDAPTLIRAAAAQSAPAPAPPDSPSLAATASAPGAVPPGVSRRLQAWTAAVLAIAGLVAVTVGGWLFLHIAHGAAICSHPAMEVCSQGYVLLTGTQLVGGAIAVAGIFSVVIAIVIALR